ncbi:MAG: acetyl-CoA carboxylase biotin carboxylase subunit [Sandaracinus sp.]|nr:acetyl-CoA carboxylase biotin carboxylase subunit [Sandaracinus sp.]|tara:strand:- start:9 stop:1544 length:1536 start_codon:yes stop_codon:yes gene_type:complete
MGENAVPFSKVLVANRGEIAVRVMRTLREMGIRSVAVYSEADRDALHVRMADEAVAIGPAPSRESYLVGEKILEACRKTGAEAIHPGYGFLSENAGFARACEAAGITFIGPDASAMEAMGSKTAAREKMMAAGVPVVPGANVTEPEALKKAAEELGYPVMLKASAGGGGKGMRLVEKAEDLVDSFERARSEAANAFGDDTVYIEKAIVGPRHIEIQVLADSHGNCVHLFERDCSIQRRHQKVIEESPSPFGLADDAKIAEMGEVAVQAAKAVDYRGAGTVEFLMGSDGSFYFLEMNTRLQVEHPITELVTGMDLVREQVRVAAGEELGYDQSAVTRRGHAIECRVYAEDPDRGFMPSPGPIEVLRRPTGPGVRDDSGTYEGSEVPSHYDPMVSKLCVWAATREQAVQRMRRALSEYVVTGIKTSVPFHLRVMDHPDFVAGEYDTGFIAAHEEALLNPPSLGVAARPLAIAAAVAQAFRDQDAMGAPAAKSNGGGGGGPGITPWRIGSLTRF